MRDERLAEALRQIKIIVDDALAGKLLPKATHLKSAGSAGSAVRPEGLPDHILALRDEGFFAQPKTFHEVHAKLEPTYPCDIDRVKVACLRLQKRKQLRKTSKLIGGKSQVAYVC
jgi:hypothetical protein